MARDGSHGLVVKGGESQSGGCEFESQCTTLNSSSIRQTQLVWMTLKTKTITFYTDSLNSNRVLQQIALSIELTRRGKFISNSKRPIRCKRESVMAVIAISRTGSFRKLKY